MSKRVLIIGAGPAGLTAAYILGKAGQSVIVLEKNPQYVGGISRTETYKGYHFDIGGHRFFSKSSEVEDFWTEILGNEMLERKRSSKIYYNKKFFTYPLIAKEALPNLGLWESFLCVLSYVQIKIFPYENPTNFEEWVCNQFGKRLYRIFFKTYTEKVWGISCKEISADWAAQRIKGLSLSSAILNALFPAKNSNDKNAIIKTLIDSFRYPKYGPGQMWKVCAEKAKSFGAEIKMNAAVTKLNYEKNKWSAALSNGENEKDFDYVLSSAPIRELIPNIFPFFPEDAVVAARQLNHRDFLTVVFILKDRKKFTDNWIYIHDSQVKVGRIQNFKAWSPYMIPDESTTCYSMEYFCFEGDNLWNSSDADLISLAKKELMQIGLAREEDILDACVVRQQKAYPVYDKNYKDNIEIIKNTLKKYPGLYLIGRNGMHKYNNQDHSMMTAMLAAKNIIAGKELFDVWKVNQDAEYIESGERTDEGGRKIPNKI
ncbi:MAG: NAD(P)/FAD-dependent oxidoreductase [Bacteroidetes bacterium]|nr:NAD(P)/FAD-dependent oxidoreductase [Bacteroidota bacterium]